jgi:exonuclease SbcC
MKLSQAGLGESESLTTALQRLQQFVDNEQARLEALRSARVNALASCQRLVSAVTAADATASTAATLGKELQDRETELVEAEKNRLEAKAIGYAARDARTAIVRRVFNEALNSLWRDLFVRLAPTEPFVPAFTLPETSGGVVAALETLHRSGQKGGTPGAMLSAGNLNTAALTLFLALHLSVQPRLPWLLLDDPVQNMDEVHIAQFAALLRTLSKEHKRKVLIAVHDRSLFDYLTLELSPAFLEDRLITVELSRSATNASVAESKYWTFQKDDTIAA